jgi:FixJ family two-component response regulator
MSVAIVDDDAGTRDLITGLLHSVHISTEPYSNGMEFLEKYDRRTTGCIVLEVRLPGMSGLEVQDRLIRDGVDIPVIFLSAYGDVPMTVRAMRNGAVDFLEKPFNHQNLIDTVHHCLEIRREQREKEAVREHIARRLRTLTHREAEVLDLLISGLTNREIAQKLDISKKTLDVHRGHIMKKMKVGALPDLFNLMYFHRGTTPRVDLAALTEDKAARR